MSDKTKRTTNYSELEVKISSPFPPPELLKQYELVQKGFAERAIEMAEKEQSHRQLLEGETLEANINFNKFAMNSEHQAKRFGQNATFIIAVLGLICGTMLLLFNKPIASLAPFSHFNSTCRTKLIKALAKG